MKTLQKNFTTPEQSKRLLELGVPENTADCFYYDWAWFPEFELYGKHINVINWDNFNEENRLRKVKVYPCWTVGRLIEISLICGIGDKVPNEFYINKYSLVDSLVENIISRLERVADLSVNDIDFSKLEE